MRIITVLSAVKDVYKRQTISVADADRMTGEAHFARAYMYYGPVSYTHLDVYKRQE